MHSSERLDAIAPKPTNPYFSSLSIQDQLQRVSPQLSNESEWSIELLGRLLQ